VTAALTSAGPVALADDRKPATQDPRAVANEEARLLNKVRTLPADDNRGRMEAYSDLGRLRPENKDYRDKAARYGEAAVADSERRFAQGKPPVSQVYQGSDTNMQHALAKAAGLIRPVARYEIHSSGQVNYYLQSTRPADARAVADGVCETAARTGMRFARTWEVRVFLARGDQPAATCALRSGPK